MLARAAGVSQAGSPPTPLKHLQLKYKAPHARERKDSPVKSWKLAGVGLAALLFGCSVVEPKPEDLAVDVARMQGVPVSQVQIENIQTSKKFVYFDAITPTGRYSCISQTGMKAFGVPPDRRQTCEPLAQ
jgi:hypothetical protein